MIRGPECGHFVPHCAFASCLAKYWRPPKTIPMLAKTIGIPSLDLIVRVHTFVQCYELPAVISILCKGYPGFQNIVSSIHMGGSRITIAISNLQAEGVTVHLVRGSKVAPCKSSPMSGSLISNHRWLTLAFSISGRGYFTRYSFSRGFNPSFTLPYLVENCFFSPIELHWW